MTRGTPVSEGRMNRPIWAAFGALGVVFGDLGTSPLYTLQTVVQAMGGHFTPHARARRPVADLLDLDCHDFDQVLPVRHAGRQSRRRRHSRAHVLDRARMALRQGAKAADRHGTARRRADLRRWRDHPGDIRVERARGRQRRDGRPSSRSSCPWRWSILLVLFGAQRFGTEKIGHAFGPVMLLWFLVIALLGIASIARASRRIAAVDPRMPSRSW